MKIFDVLFLAIREHEFDFLVRRHNIDVQLYSEFDSAWEVQHIKHHEDGYRFRAPPADQVFFRGNNSFFHLPLRLARYVYKEKPDILIVHSFRFAFQAFILKFFLPRKTRIIVQHHGEPPYRNPVKLWLQRQAFKNAGAFLFSSAKMAEAFISKGIIPRRGLIHEMPESSTNLHAGDKRRAQDALQLQGEHLRFLWVGRLNANKDPLTVLEAFDRFSQDHAAELFMFYHESELLPEVMGFIQARGLAGRVHLKGYLEQAALEEWFRACDYFISASHYESTGYALCEALATGCVPIASNIPSFQKLTNDGDCAILFEPGKPTDLYEKLKSLSPTGYEELRQKGIGQFRENLSFEALSRKLAGIIRLVHEGAHPAGCGSSPQ